MPVEESDWQKMSYPLQIEFAKLVSEMLDQYKKRMLETEKNLDAVLGRHQDLIKDVPSSDNWKKWKIIGIDGSSSGVDDRNGISVACISTTAIEIDLEKEKFVDAWYLTDLVINDGSLGLRSSDALDDYIALKRMELERKMLKKVCERKPNLIIIDGPFFPSNRVIDCKSKDAGFDELKNICEYTMAVKRSGIPVISTTKRSTSVYFHALNMINKKNFPRVTDKLFTTALLGPKKYCYLDKVSKTRKTSYRVSWKGYDKGEKQAERFLESIWKRLDKDFIDVFDSHTYFVKSFSNVDAVKIEVPKYCGNVEADILAFLIEWANPDTGLPFVMDLVDALSNVPRGFSKEFTAEVEAGLYSMFDDPKKINLIKRFFTPLNPQHVYKEI